MTNSLLVNVDIPIDTKRLKDQFLPIQSMDLVPIPKRKFPSQNSSGWLPAWTNIAIEAILKATNANFRKILYFLGYSNGVQYSIILWYHNRCTYYILNQFNIPTNFRENCHAFTLVTNPGISQQLKPRGGKSYFMFNGVSSPISLCHHTNEDHMRFVAFVAFV